MTRPATRAPRVPLLRFGKGLGFHLGPIPVQIDASFLIMSLFMASSRLDRPALLVSWLAVVFVSILVHELGHAAAYRAYGFSPRIELHGMGGLTYGDGGGRLTPTRSVLVSLAGPGAGFALGGAAWLVARVAPGLAASPVAAVVLADALWVNVGWGIANLLPILPLDGGQALRAVLAARIGARAERVSYVVSVGAAVAAGAAALWAGMTWAAFLAAIFAVQSFRALQTLTRARRDEPLREPLARATEAYERGDTATAERLAADLLPHLHSDATIAVAAHLTTYGALARGDLDAALLGIARFPSGAGPDPRIVAPTFHAVEEALFHARRFDEAAGVGREGFARFHDPRFAYNVACSESRAGRPRDAADWLDRAIGAGWTDLAATEADPDLAPLRAHSAWERIRARLAAQPQAPAETDAEP